MSPTADNLNNHELTIQQSLDGFSYIIDNDKHTLVPAALYQENKKSRYLDFLGLKEENVVVCADYIDLADMYNIYCVSKKEHARLRAENTEFRHSSSVLLTNLIKENLQRTDDARIYLNVKDQHFEMIVLKGANLLFDNSFRFKTKEDFLYFLLFAMEQLHLDTETVPVYFMGMIEKDSQIADIISRYVRDVRFKKDLI